MKLFISLLFAISWCVFYVLCTPAIDKDVYKENIEMLDSTHLQERKSVTGRRGSTSESQPDETADYKKYDGLMSTITKSMKNLHSINLILGKNAKTGQKEAGRAVNKHFYKENIEMKPMTRSTTQVDSSQDSEMETLKKRTHTI